MKALISACLILLAASGVGAAERAGNPVRLGPRLSQTSSRHEFRRGSGRGGEFEGPRLCIHALEQRHGPAYGAAAAQLLEFDPNGKFLREIGKGLYAWSLAHSVRIDKDDNIWAIDKGSDMIVKFNPAGRVVWVFGRRKESADGDRALGHVNPPLPPVDGRSVSRPTSPGTRRATSTSPTVTSIHASPSTTRTATG